MFCCLYFRQINLCCRFQNVVRSTVVSLTADNYRFIRLPTPVAGLRQTLCTTFNNTYADDGLFFFSEYMLW